MHRGLIAPLMFGILGAAILIWLGMWQMQRLDWKRDILNQIETRISAPPAPLPAVPNPDTEKYMPVSLTGDIETGEIHVLVSRKHVGAGYRVIAPFLMDDGRRILLDRGFITTPQKKAERKIGPVAINGNVHWPDDRNSSTPDNDVSGNIWFARDIPQMAEVLKTEPILVVQNGTSEIDPTVTPLPVDTSGIPNDHLQYAITWFSLAIVWLIMTATYIWRTRARKES